MNSVMKTEYETTYDIMEKVIALGDLSKLNAKERLEYYSKICSTLGLNPLTRPFEFIKFDGKLTLYSRKDCSEQLRAKRRISIYKIETKIENELFIYTAYARAADGQEDVGTGAVSIKGLSGKSLANAVKIAETQAKRRVTLSICGLSFTDESEVPDVPNVTPVDFNHETGELVDYKDFKKLPTLAGQEQVRAKLVNDVLIAATIEELHEAYKKAWLAHAGNSSIMQDITDIKDKRKIELEGATHE